MRNLMAAALVLAAVQPASAAVRPPDPCSLLDDTQVARLIGPIHDHSRTDRSSLGPSCTWRGRLNRNPALSPYVRVELFKATETEFKQNPPTGSGKRLPLRTRFGVPTYEIVRGVMFEIWHHGFELTILISARKLPTAQSTGVLIREAAANL